MGYSTSRDSSVGRGYTEDLKVPGLIPGHGNFVSFIFLSKVPFIKDVIDKGGGFFSKK